jgi:hypothetical protein
VVDRADHSTPWKAVLDSAWRLAGRCAIYLSKSPDEKSRDSCNTPIPNVKAWRLVEALSLLMILSKAEKMISNEVINLLGRTGPLHFRENGADRFLWAQKLVTATKW